MQKRTTFNTTPRREGCLLEAQGAMLAADTLAFTASASEAKPLMKRVASGMTPSDRTWKLRDSHDLLGKGWCFFLKPHGVPGTLVKMQKYTHLIITNSYIPGT